MLQITLTRGYSNAAICQEFAWRIQAPSAQNRQAQPGVSTTRRHPSLDVPHTDDRRVLHHMRLVLHQLPMQTKKGGTTPCFHAKPAWQAKLGAPLSFSWIRGYRVVMVPCGTCQGCIKAHAQAWAFRCHLEGTRLPHNTFTTLTYDDEHKPFTLHKQHLQRFLKNLRQSTALPLRFFASGEYGSRTHRPHYHAILFGYDALRLRNQQRIQDAWGKGQVRSEALTPARIAYCAGYTDKKATDKFLSVAHADPETGEIWQPPFIQMSRRPGLAAHARQWKDSWRLFAIHDGKKLSVPRYLHKPWRDTATEQDLQQLQAEKDQYITETKDYTARMIALEKITNRKQQLSQERRHV